MKESQADSKLVANMLSSLSVPLSKVPEETEPSVSSK